MRCAIWKPCLDVAQRHLSEAGMIRVALKLIHVLERSWEAERGQSHAVSIETTERNVNILSCPWVVCNKEVFRVSCLYVRQRRQCKVHGPVLDNTLQ